MKKLGCVLCIVVMSVMGGCARQQNSSSANLQPISVNKPAEARPPGQQQLYTAYNIWIVPSHNMKCINYKYGRNILPAGTPVQKVHIGEDDRPPQEYIGFETAGDNRKFKIYYQQSWHPGKKIDDFKNIMFTPQTFQEMTEGLSQREIEAIQAGHVVEGMTRKAVLIAYGYPPEHKTPTLDQNVWMYWSNKLTSFNVCFDDKQITMTCK